MSSTVVELRNVHLNQPNGSVEKNSSTKENVQNEEDAQQQLSGINTCCEKTATLCPSEMIFKCISGTLTNSYDLLTILISLADVTTDVWVIYNYKVTGRQLFFDISLAVMIIAQLSYAIALVARFEDSICSRPCQHFCLFIAVLPLTPFMSFIFYLMSFPDNCIVNMLENLGFDDEFSKTVTKQQAPILIWIKKKLLKHMGFIMEGMYSICYFFFVVVFFLHFCCHCEPGQSCKHCFS